MIKRIAWTVAALIVLVVLAGAYVLHSYGESGNDPAFFEREIRAFEAEDREAMPAAGGIVFVGSSSIRLWSTLDEDMAPLPALNRGFGGAHLSHVIHNAARIILPYAPRAVVVYAGDNDVGAGKTVERVVADYEALVALIHEALPEARIYFLPIKPSKLRFALWPEMAEANARIEAINAGDPRLASIDVASVLLNDAGEPRDDVFLFDGLHLNANGYAAWTAVVAPALMRDFPEWAETR